MRVLHVLNTGKYSGAENVVITLIHALEGSIECAYASPDGPIRDILDENRIKFYPVSTSATNARELKLFVEDFRPDVIHTHDYNAGIMACLTGTRIPVINHLHNNTPWLKKICPKSIAYLASCANYRKILTVSNSVMEDFIFGKIEKKKSLVVGNPIDITEIRRRADETGILQESTDVIFLGRLAEEKNPMLFLEIVSELVKTIPDLRAAMVGNGLLRRKIEEYITERNLTDNVRLYGFQKNPYGLLKASKVMCMPSKWEGFGLAAVEALSLGVPVLAGNVGGLKEIVNDTCGKKCTYLSDYTSETQRLLSDPEYYRIKKNGALVRASQLNNATEYAQKIISIYHEVLRR